VGGRKRTGTLGKSNGIDVRGVKKVGEGTLRQKGDQSVTHQGRKKKKK